VIAVLFEVWAADGREQTYLELAAALRPSLDEIDGFLSIERFASLTDRSKLLSLSYWRDEAAITRWRTTWEHRAAQAQGRAEVFRDYRLRVATVVRDYGRDDRAQAPADAPAR
jgi:heme-degrading monooxygenase HmoA